MQASRGAPRRVPGRMTRRAADMLPARSTPAYLDRQMDAASNQMLDRSYDLTLDRSYDQTLDRCMPAKGQGSFHLKLDGRNQSKGSKKSATASRIGHAPLYWIVFQFADRSKITPLDSAAAPTPHRLWIGGQPLDVEENRLVDASVARDIIEHFGRKGEPHPNVNWAHT